MDPRAPPREGITPRRNPAHPAAPTTREGENRGEASCRASVLGRALFGSARYRGQMHDRP